MFTKRGPRTYTRAEQVIERLAEAMITDGRTYRVIASDLGLSPSTVGNIARRHTKWPRPQTLFAILDHYTDIELRIKGNGK